MKQRSWREGRRLIDFCKWGVLCFGYRSSLSACQTLRIYPNQFPQKTPSFLPTNYHNSLLKDTYTFYNTKTHHFFIIFPINKVNLCFKCYLVLLLYPSFYHKKSAQLYAFCDFYVPASDFYKNMLIINVLLVNLRINPDLYI